MVEEIQASRLQKVDLIYVRWSLGGARVFLALAAKALMVTAYQQICCSSLAPSFCILVGLICKVSWGVLGLRFFGTSLELSPMMLSWNAMTACSASMFSAGPFWGGTLGRVCNQLDFRHILFVSFCFLLCWLGLLSVVRGAFVEAILTVYWDCAVVWIYLLQKRIAVHFCGVVAINFHLSQK